MASPLDGSDEIGEPIIRHIGPHEIIVTCPIPPALYAHLKAYAVAFVNVHLCREEAVDPGGDLVAIVEVDVGLSPSSRPTPFKASRASAILLSLSCWT